MSSRWRGTKTLELSATLFDEWKATDSEIRTYLELSNKWVQDSYDKVFEDAEREYAHNFDPDTDDPDGHVGLFETRVSGLWPRDFFWMLQSGALRDAVSAFEVYAEKAIIEILKWYRFRGRGWQQMPVGADGGQEPNVVNANLDAVGY